MKEKRKICDKCKRALGGCICSFAIATQNPTPITILRHPSEIKNFKGTVDLISLSLTNCRIFDGEVFERDSIIMEGFENILIFPNDKAISLLEVNRLKSKNFHFIFIDGTWKKTYKIFQSNSFLQEVPSVFLKLDEVSPYSEVRKQRESGMSTLEAVCTTLGEVEGSEHLYQPLLNNFKKFIGRIKSFQS